MPIYEYVCETCGSEFEVIQKFSEPELKTHDCAPKSKVHRKMSLTSFHLQGGGWYASGYGAGGSNGSSNGSAPKASGAAKTESPSTASSTSESSTPAKTSGVSAAGGCGTSCACH